MEAICKLYLELANVVPEKCVSSREIQLLGLLRDSYVYVAGEGRSQEHRNALALDIARQLKRLDPS